jgi:hypothetical protein
LPPILDNLVWHLSRLHLQQWNRFLQAESDQ